MSVRVPQSEPTIAIAKTRAQTEISHERDNVMKPEFTKLGPKHDYTGAHVVWHGALGTIRDVYSDEWGMTRCKVQYFCGDWWPHNPALSVLKILERTYKQEAA